MINKLTIEQLEGLKKSCEMNREYSLVDIINKEIEDRKEKDVLKDTVNELLHKDIQERYNPLNLINKP